MELGFEGEVSSIGFVRDGCDRGHLIYVHAVDCVMA